MTEYICVCDWFFMLCSFYFLQVVLTGARSIADIEEGWRVIWLLIKPFIVRRQ